MHGPQLSNECQTSWMAEPKGALRFRMLPAGAGILCVAMLLPSCDKAQPPVARDAALSAPVASSGATASEPSKPFVFPPAKQTSLKEIPATVNRAKLSLPKDQWSKIDEWLQEVPGMPIELRGPTRRFLSDVTPTVACHVGDALSFSLNGKLDAKGAYVITSSLECLTKEGTTLKKIDWPIQPGLKRGEVVPFSIDEAFLVTCWAEGGGKLGVEVLTSPCAVPFPRQVRCAGEHATCRQTCKDDEACNQKCESNRLGCLDVCKK